MNCEQKIFVSIIFTMFILSSVAIISIIYYLDKDIKQCKQRCSLVNEDYSSYFNNDEDKLICYCKSKLHIVNGIVR